MPLGVAGKAAGVSTQRSVTRNIYTLIGADPADTRVRAPLAQTGSESATFQLDHAKPTNEWMNDRMCEHWVGVGQEKEEDKQY